MGAERADGWRDEMNGIQLLQALVGKKDRQAWTCLKERQAGRQARTWICFGWLAGWAGLVGCVGHVGVELLAGCALR